MSQRNVASSIVGKRGGKQSADLRVAKGEPAGVYDALLFVSLGFLLMGVVFLVLELMKYDFRITP